VKDPTPMEHLELNIQEMVSLMELSGIHYAREDGDFLRPGDLRGLLRQMSYCLLGLYEYLRGLDDKPKS